MSTPENAAAPAGTVGAVVGASVSEEFERAFGTRCAGPVRECDCGRTCFDGVNDYDWEDGEFERLEAGERMSPKRYYRMNYAVETMAVAGREIVMGCPCNGAAGYERFIVQHAAQIADFLNARAERLISETKATIIKSHNPSGQLPADRKATP